MPGAPPADPPAAAREPLARAALAAVRSSLQLPHGRRPDPSRGIALGLGVLVPLAVGEATGHLPEGVIAALGALQAILADVGGSDRRRLGGMAAASVLDAGALALGTAVADPRWLGVLVAVVLAPLAGVVGAAGEMARVLAFNVTLIFLVAEGLPAGGQGAGERFLLALAGGTWAIAVTAGLLLMGLRAGPIAGDAPASLTGRLMHGLRFGLAAAAAVALAAALGLDRGYWLALTVAVVLRPTLDPTLVRSAHRLVGTLVGAGLAAVVIATGAGVSVLLPVAAGSLALAGALLQVHYGLAVTWITLGVLSMLELVRPDDVEIADERVLNTVLGLAVAIVALLVWPRPRGTTPAAGAPAT